MPKNSKRLSKDDKELEGFAFVGAFFLGFSIGIMLGNWAVSPFLAIAFGFIAMASVRANRK